MHNCGSYDFPTAAPLVIWLMMSQTSTRTDTNSNIQCMDSDSLDSYVVPSSCLIEGPLARKAQMEFTAMNILGFLISTGGCITYVADPQ